MKAFLEKIKKSRIYTIAVTAIKYVVEIIETFFAYRGNLLARGVAYAILVAIVPAIFVALYVATLVFNNSPTIQATIGNYIADMLPVTVSVSIMDQINEFMSSGQWKSMGVIGFGMLIITPTIVFSAIERALSFVMEPAEEKNIFIRQLFYFLIQFLVVALLIAVSFLSTLFSWFDTIVHIPNIIRTLLSKSSTTIVITFTLAAIYRLSYHRKIKRTILYPVSLIIAILWNFVSQSAFAIIALSGRNKFAFGLMASATVVMALAYIFSALIIIGGIVIAKESKKDDEKQLLKEE